MKAINLIPAPRIAMRQRRIWSGRCLVTCVGYAAVVAVVTAGAQAVVSHDGVELSGRLVDTAAEFDRTSAALARIRTDLDATESLLRSSRSIAEQPDWSALLGLLSSRTQGQIVLKSVAVRPREIAPPQPATPARPGARGKAPPPPDPTILVNITGAAPSQAAASQYALRLESTGLFGRVTLLDTNRDAYVGLLLVSFRIECTLGDPAAKPAAVPGVLHASAGGDQ
jgi:hypothetical protein